MITVILLWAIGIGDADLELHAGPAGYSRPYSASCELGLGARCQNSRFAVLLASG